MHQFTEVLLLSTRKRAVQCHVCLAVMLLCAKSSVDVHIFILLSMFSRTV